METDKEIGTDVTGDLREVGSESADVQMAKEFGSEILIMPADLSDATAEPLNVVTEENGILDHILRCLVLQAANVLHASGKKGTMLSTIGNA